MIIREIENKDVNQVAKNMALSFANDPVYNYILPDEKRRFEFIEKFMKFRLKYSIKYGKVFVSDDLQGVAIWIKPNYQIKAEHLPSLGGVVAMLSLDKDEKARFQEMADNTAFLITKYTDNKPYWMLSPVCVTPNYQNKGYGTALVKYGQSIVKRTSYPCFLDTQSKINKARYEKLGYKLVSETTVPNTTITHYIMSYK